MLREYPEKGLEAESQLGLGLGVLVLYEDMETALRARGSLRRFLPELPEPEEPLCGLWKIDLLRDSLLRERAAAEAAAADIIIISLHRTESIRAEFWDWMRRWQDRRQDEACALGVLLDSMPAAETVEDAVLACIQRLTEAAGADFFCGACDTPVSPRNPRTWIPFQTMSRTPSHSPPASHWGINE